MVLAGCSIVSGLDDFRPGSQTGGGGSTATGGGGSHPGGGGQGGSGGLPCSNGVLFFDGEDDVVRVQAGTTLNPGGPFTVELWFSLAEPIVTDEQRLLSYNSQGCCGYNLAFTPSSQGFPATGAAWFRVYDGNVVQSIAPDPVPAAMWHHIAGVWDDSEIRLYLDGVRVGGSPPVPSVGAFDGDFVIGATSSANSRHFHGAIDEVRLSNVPRYLGAGFTPDKRLADDDATIALWRFEEGEGSLAADHVGGHDGVLEGSSGPSNGPQWTTECF